MAEDVSEEIEGEDDAPKKKSKLPLILGLVLALVGGGGSFFAIYSGMLFGAPAEDTEAEEPEEVIAGPEVEFVAVDPMTISLGAAADNRHLRFRANLEVPKGKEDGVTTLLPRVVDVLNSYLRALEVADLEDPAALTRLRAQMLRRIQVVTGPGQVNDLLVMEFVMN
ncbi:flagellar basal body-associated FliL family protein [Pseudooceanicola onchidii]|uniref:flagellar basal body-associated FliL family protein n=1 Tax=Pseudooceanicola onchidii TaxID=2562279 RepID=UPI0010A9E8DC|nr:flagellar basal body-associated FliL family protein [Pseudooceanicola onchidii]